MSIQLYLEITMELLKSQLMKLQKKILMYYLILIGKGQNNLVVLKN